MANPKPTIVFSINLSNKENSLLPYNLNLVGNETVTETNSQVNARTTWLPTLGAGVTGYSNTGVGGNIAGKNNNTFTAYGLNALYLKRTYASGTANDVLTVVSESWV
jgi:hypothetical protein